MYLHGISISVWIASNGSSSSLGAVVLFGGSNRQAHTFADTWKFDLGTMMPSGQ